MIRYLLIALLIPGVSAAQDFEIKSGSSRPPDPEVLALVRKYTPLLMGWTSPADRDEKRRPMVVSDYFYHGTDGSGIGYDGLTARHTKNNLRILDRKFSDAILYQYENTAILTYKDRSRGLDKGKPFEGYGSNAIVMTRTLQGWRVAADIVGADPPDPEKKDENKN
jgi:hypothetical protein